jgi:predicted nucleic acid-binding protein
MFLDTTIIIEIFRSEKEDRKFAKIFDLIQDEPLFISIIQIGEISDWCLNNGINPSDRISKLNELLNIIPIDEKICIEGSKIKYQMRKKGVLKFSLIDGIILASARTFNQKLLTTVSDFRKAEDAIFLQ